MRGSNQGHGAEPSARGPESGGAPGTGSSHGAPGEGETPRPGKRGLIGRFNERRARLVEESRERSARTREWGRKGSGGKPADVDDRPAAGGSQLLKSATAGIRETLKRATGNFSRRLDAVDAGDVLDPVQEMNNTATSGFGSLVGGLKRGRSHGHAAIDRSLNRREGALGKGEARDRTEGTTGTEVPKPKFGQAEGTAAGAGSPVFGGARGVRRAGAEGGGRSSATEAVAEAAREASVAGETGAAPPIAAKDREFGR